MKSKKELIIDQLKEVYDPEFPIVDVYTLGLIYEVSVDEKNESAHILITFTTPACPMADMIEEMIKNAVLLAVPWYSVVIEITFDPMRSMDSIRDQDVRRMFE